MFRIVLFAALLALCGPAWAVSPSPLSSAGVTAVPSTAAETGHVLKAAPGNLYSVTATNQTSTAAFLVLLNASAIPSTGTITGVQQCVPIPASGSVTLNYNPPSYYTTGVVAVVTSAASCFTYTTGTVTAFISGAVQ